jgi:hypothetical protein
MHNLPKVPPMMLTTATSRKDMFLALLRFECTVSSGSREVHTSVPATIKATLGRKKDRTESAHIRNCQAPANEASSQKSLWDGKILLADTAELSGGAKSEQSDR